MIRVLTQQNPVYLNETVIAGQNYSNGEGDNAGIFGFTPQQTQTSGQPFGMITNQGNQGGFTNIADSISKMTSGSGQQGGGANPMDYISTLAPLANQLLQKRPLSEVEGVCGKQPSFLSSKSKKDAWQKCANNYSRSKVQLAPQSSKEETPKMSTKTKVLIGVVGVLVLGTIVYLATKKK